MATDLSSTADTKQFAAADIDIAGATPGGRTIDVMKSDVTDAASGLQNLSAEAVKPVFIVDDLKPESTAPASTDDVMRDVTCCCRQPDGCDVIPDPTSRPQEVGPSVDDSPGMKNETEGSGCTQAVEKVRLPSRVECGECKVCGDEATGMYFGALVCVPCKTFFLRYTAEGEEVGFMCKKGGNCEISVATRTHCKMCRYKKCLDVGMCRRVRPTQVEITDGQLLCVVCGDIGNGVHFGAVTCEGCKKFYRRGLQEQATYKCKFAGNCVINPRTRNACRYCRFRKCIDAGMSRGAIQMGRPSKASRSTSDPQGLGGQQQQQQQQHSSSPSVDVIDTSSGPVDLSFRHHSHFNQLTATTLNGAQRRLSKNTSSASKRKMSTVVCSEPDSTIGVQTAAQLTDLGAGDEVSVRSWPDSEPFWTRGAVAAVAAAAAVGGRNCSKRCCRRQLTCDVSTSALRRSVTAATASASTVYPDDIDARVSAAGDVEAMDWHSVDVDNEDDDDGMGSPSVTSSGRRASFDDQDDVVLFGPAMTCCASSTSQPMKHFEASECRLKNRLISGSSGVSSDFENVDKTVECDEVLFDMLDLDQLMTYSVKYWVSPRLPDENVMFADVHWDIIKHIIPAYNRFVNLGTAINRSLSNEFDTLIRHTADPQTVPKWIQKKVIPVYTILSVSFCKSLPGFSDFAAEDQITILRLGQSSSRILAASLNWFDAEEHNFRNFLSWRRTPDIHDPTKFGFDLFKQQLIVFAEAIIREHLDPVEAALLNVLLIAATDFPNLKRPDVIEETRQKILSTFRAYTTAKYGTPNHRLETIFAYVPNVRRLGFLHYMMTTTPTMTAEEVENHLKLSSSGH